MSMDPIHGASSTGKHQEAAQTNISRAMLSTSEAVHALSLGTLEELAENVEIPQTKLSQPFDSTRAARSIEEAKKPLPGQQKTAQQTASVFRHLGDVLRKG